ncbi:MAG: F0F1 ATP synthase subunit epsilon [Candidatus Eisenbacteria bacterium]|nr:F0F1 ATP synthase subunit epsilon [Candidatus Eisenbacteria bacterium]
MPELFRLSVLTPVRSVFDAEVISIVAPGSEGYLGVLAHHAPLITALAPGRLTVKVPDEDDLVFCVSGGFLEVSDNRAVVLADALELPEEIDLARAKGARDRARERLRDTSGKIDQARAEAALRRALNRIRVFEGAATKAR